MGEHSTFNIESRMMADAGHSLNVECSMFPFRAFVLALLLFGSHHAFATTNSPLADAVEKQDHAAFRKLLEQHDEVNASQADGMTALHWAAYLDDLEAAKS